MYQFLPVRICACRPRIDTAAEHAVETLHPDVRCSDKGIRPELGEDFDLENSRIDEAIKYKIDNPVFAAQPASRFAWSLR